MNDSAPASAVTYADIEAAARRLQGVAHRTPVATSRTFDELAGCQAFFLSRLTPHTDLGISLPDYPANDHR